MESTVQHGSLIFLSYLIHSLLGNHERKAIDALTHKRVVGGILQTKSVQTLGERKTLYYPLSFVLHNAKPIGHQVIWPAPRMLSTDISQLKMLHFNCLRYTSASLQDLVGLVISILLLGDFSLVLLTLLQLYSISLLDLFLFLFILPLGILFPFPAGINALFSHGARRASGLARFYALWNIMSLVNVVSCSLPLTHHLKQRLELGTNWFVDKGPSTTLCIT